jgi:hypothetical protein
MTVIGSSGLRVDPSSPRLRLVRNLRQSASSRLHCAPAFIWLRRGKSVRQAADKVSALGARDLHCLFFLLHCH